MFVTRTNLTTIERLSRVPQSTDDFMFLRIFVKIVHPTSSTDPTPTCKEQLTMFSTITTLILLWHFHSRPLVLPSEAWPSYSDPREP